MQVVAVRIRIHPDGGWEVAAAPRGKTAKRGHVSEDQVQAIKNAAAVLYQLDEADPQTWRRAETRTGRALAGALEAHPAVARSWFEALGAIEPSGEPGVVVVDVDPLLADLPWELMAPTSTSEPLDRCGMATVARFTHGATTLPAQSDEPTAWVEGRLGTSRILDPVHGALRRAWSRRALPGPVLPQDAEGPRIVTLLADAEGRDVLRRAFTHGNMGPLESAIVGAEVAWLAIVGGKERFAEGMDHVAERAVQKGALSCQHAPFRISLDAAMAYGASMLESLNSGLSVGLSTLIARHAIDALDRPGIENRWWTTRWHIGHPSVVHRAPCPARYLPAGWPHPNEEGAKLLLQAHAFADLDGFLGVEHLAEATAEMSPTSLGEVGAAIQAHAPRWRARIEALVPQTTRRRASPLVTPRLKRVGERLSEGFAITDLWAAILAEPWAWARWIDTTQEALEHDLAAEILEVIGGPDDGRRIPMKPGDTVGRYAPEVRADHLLYKRSPLTDRRLSRSHIAWVAPGSFKLLAPSRYLRLRSQGIEDRGTPMWVRHGDLLELTPGTAFVGLHPTKT